MKKLLAAVISVLALGFAASNASAATCTATSPLTDPDATLTDSGPCGPGLLNDANDSEADVQTVTGDPLWTLVGAVGNSGLLTFTGTTGGDWFSDVSGAPDTDYLIVIKDGAAPGGAGDSISWVWFDVDTSVGCANPLFDFCGTWTMYGDGGKIKDISHMSLYSQEGADQLVPEPSTLMLLGVAIVGLAAVRRRRSV